MPTFHRDTLLPLARSHSFPSVSLYLPTHRMNSEKEQDRIVYKNLVSSVHEKLSASELSPADVARLCAPLHELLDNQSFWRETGDGLAVFLSADIVETLKLDTTVPSLAVVGDRFYLRPLIAATDGDQRFYALAIDRGGCRLFYGDGSCFEPVELGNIPSSLADELRYDETQQSVQYSSVPAPGSSSGAVFHGHGGEKDTDKGNLERYLRKVEAAVAHALIADRNVPLLLLGVEYELALYRSLNTYPGLVKQQVTGATDELTAFQIHARSLEALAPVFEAVATKYAAELDEQEGSPLTTHDPKVIAQAAAEGRVKAIYFDDAVHPTNGDGWDLVDLAAVETVLHGGEVHAFAGEDAPMHGFAAVLRY